MPRARKPATITDALTALAASAPGPKLKPCKVVRLVDALDAARDPRGAALRALLDPGCGHSNASIAQACRESGILVTYETIRKHRLGMCGCPA